MSKVTKWATHFGFALLVLSHNISLAQVLPDVPLATHWNGKPFTVHIPETSIRPSKELSVTPFETAQVEVFSPSTALNWATDLFFSPQEAARKKFYYVYEPEKCMAIGGPQLAASSMAAARGDDKFAWGLVDRKVLNVLTEQRLGSIPLTTWTVQGPITNKDPWAEMLASFRDQLTSYYSDACQFASNKDYLVVTNQPIPSIEPDEKLVATLIRHR